MEHYHIGNAFLYLKLTLTW